MAQTDNNHKDFLYYLLKQRENGSLDDNEIIVNGALFMYVPDHCKPSRPCNSHTPLNIL